MIDITQHNTEIALNLQHWAKKPVLRNIYRGYHEQIAAHLRQDLSRATVELGSGIGNIKEVVPHCLRTDLFPNPWIDQLENAYHLSFGDGTVANFILFDVFHHLRYPGTALAEIGRALSPGGRVIIFDPYISLFGFLVYGALHHEPIGWRETIEWKAPHNWDYSTDTYYAAQGNATRLFFDQRYQPWIEESGFRLVSTKRISGFSYVLSGGYSKPQMLPISVFPLVRYLDRLLELAPSIFCTRTLVVLEKRP